MKIIVCLAVGLLLAGCDEQIYTSSGAQDNYVTVPLDYNPPKRVIYSEYSPPVIAPTPVCYMKTVPIYGTQRIVHNSDGTSVIVGSAIGAVVGSELSDGDTLGAAAGAIIGGVIANQPRVTTRRVVVGSGQKKVCNTH